MENFLDLLGRKVYFGAESGEGITLYQGPGTNYAVHAELDSDELAKADFFVGKGKTIELGADDFYWLRLDYNKPVYLQLWDGMDATCE